MIETTRKCFRCGEVKSAWDFPPNRLMASGRDIRCRDCVKDHMEMFDSMTHEKFDRRVS